MWLLSTLSNSCYIFLLSEYGLWDICTGYLCADCGKKFYHVSFEKQIRIIAPKVSAIRSPKFLYHTCLCYKCICDRFSKLLSFSYVQWSYYSTSYIVPSVMFVYFVSLIFPSEQMNLSLLSSNCVKCVSSSRWHYFKGCVITYATLYVYIIDRTWNKIRSLNFRECVHCGQQSEGLGVHYWPQNNSNLASSQET